MQSNGVLSGHRGAVSCLQLSSSGTHLLSGSEDGTVRVWELSAGRSAKCLAMCFESDIESVSEGLVLKYPLGQVSLSDGGDEVSNLALNAKGDLLAISMDSGVINLIPVKKNGTFCENAGATRYKRLSRFHTNIVNTINFKKNNPRELVSGGFDYNACVWDTDRGRPKASTSFAKLPSEDKDGEDSHNMKIVNPPFVMSIDYALGGKCVVAALGDGTVRILNAKDMKHITAIEAHDCMITALLVSDSFIVTGGTDCRIRAYKLVIPESSINSTSSKVGAKKILPNATIDFEVVHLFTIRHDAKVNAIACVFESIEYELAETVNTAFIAENAGDANIVSGVMDQNGEVKCDSAGLGSTEGYAVRSGGDAGATAQKCVCRCYVADTTNLISVYTQSFD